jgi:hypothetical protein
MSISFLQSCATLYSVKFIHFKSLPVYVSINVVIISTTHNRREYNPQTQTHMRIEGTYTT